MGWVRTHKPAAAAIGLVGGVGALLLIRHSYSASGTSSTTPAADTSQTGVSTDPGLYGYGSGSYDGYSGDMSGLQNGLSGSTVAGLPTSTVAGVTSSTGSTDSTAAATGGATGTTSDSGPSSPSSPSTPAPSPNPVKRTWIPSRTITVAKGQTLMSLSKSLLGTTNRAQLAHANKLGTGAGLRTGQKLIVPGHYVS